jgi:hypothetical protein
VPHFLAREEGFVATSLSDYLRLAGPHVPPALVSAGALADLGRIAGLLPAVSASGFECRLGVPEARADLGVRFWEADGSRAVLAGREDAGFQLPERLLTHPVWQRLRRFGRQWDTPGSPLHAEVESIFLEFDDEGSPADLPLPSFFIEYDHRARNRTDIMEEALTLLWGEPLAPDVRARVRVCLEALPPGAHVSSVGAMFSRRFQGVRLYFFGLGPHNLAGYLSAVGWPGPTGTLGGLLDGVADRVKRFSLGLDVGASVLPKVGVECHLTEHLEEAAPQWALLLERFVEQGVCLPAKRDALLGWLGHTHFRARAGALPENLRGAASGPGPELIAAFLRRINHVKLAFQPGQPPELKAYLTFYQAWAAYDAARKAPVLGDLAQVRGRVLE